MSHPTVKLKVGDTYLYAPCHEAYSHNMTAVFVGLPPISDSRAKLIPQLVFRICVVKTEKSCKTWYFSITLLAPVMSRLRESLWIGLGRNWGLSWNGGGVEAAEEGLKCQENICMYFEILFALIMVLWWLCGGCNLIGPWSLEQASIESGP